MIASSSKIYSISVTAYTPPAKKQAIKALKHIFSFIRGRESPAGAGISWNITYFLSVDWYATIRETN